MHTVPTEFGMRSLFRLSHGSLRSLVMDLQRVARRLCSTISWEVGSAFRTSDSLPKTFLKPVYLPPSSSTWNCFSCLVTARSCISNSRTTLARRSRAYAESRPRSAGLQGRRQSSRLLIADVPLIVRCSRCITNGSVWICAEWTQVNSVSIIIPVHVDIFPGIRAV